MKKSFINWIKFIVVVVLFWELFSILLNNNFILPSPFTVLKTMISFLGNIKFYTASLFTIIRVIVSIILSFILAFFSSFLCARFPLIKDYFSKLLLIIRTLPNVAIIILLLFWIPREMTVLVVTLFLLFPIIHEELYNTITQINHEYHDLFYIYPQSFFRKLKFVYMPLMHTAISSTLISTGTLAFKVIVMAEILAQISVGIGRQIQIARVNVELHEVMAWSIWIIIFVFIFNYLYKTFIHYIFK